MNPVVRKSFYKILTICSLMPLMLCQSDQIAGSTSTETGTIQGVAFRKDLQHGASGASLTLVSVDQVPSLYLRKASTKLTVRTDSVGRYTFKSVPEGTYNIIAEQDGLMFCVDSVSPSEKVVDLGVDTLKKPGFITGKIRMEGVDDPRTVFILTIGTNTLTAPANNKGDFTLGPVPEGKFLVRFLSTIDLYTPFDTLINFKSGVNDTLVNPISLPYKGVPVLKKLTAKWDSVMFKAEISWDPIDSSEILGYQLFRGIVGNSLSLKSINDEIIRNSMFTDTTCSLNVSYYYTVKAVGKNGELSNNFSNTDTVNAFGIWEKSREFNLQTTKRYNGPSSFVKDSLLYVVNSSDTIIEIYNSSGTMVSKIGDKSANKFFILLSMCYANGSIYTIEIDSSKSYYDSFTSDKSSKDMFFLVKKLSLKGDLLHVDSIGPTSYQNWSHNMAKLIVTKDETYYLFGYNTPLYWFKESGLKDSIKLEMLTSITAPLQSFTLFNNIFIFGCGTHDTRSQISKMEITKLDKNFIVEKRITSSTYFNTLAVDSTGHIYTIIKNSQLNILNENLDIDCKFPLQPDDYRYIAAENGNLLYIFSLANKISIYEKR